MSYKSLSVQVKDEAFRARVSAAVHKEVYANPTLAESAYGIAVRADRVDPAATFIWPLAVDTEAAYSYAVDTDNPSPGGDPAVITDAVILSGVQTHWPDAWPPE